MTTVWVGTGRDEPHRISYAQLRSGDRAGTITVTVDEADETTVVTTTYHLTPLTAAAQPELDRFAAHYPTFLDSWRQAIESWLARTEGVNG